MILAITQMNEGTTSAMDNKTVGVYLTPEDAEIFKIFQKYYPIWKRVFWDNDKQRDNRNKEIRLFFNDENKLRVGKEIVTFK